MPCFASLVPRVLQSPTWVILSCHFRHWDRLFNKVGFLVVKDPVGTAMAERKQEVPGVIGSNIFRDMRDTLQKTIRPGFLHGLTDSFG